jgi:uncharacterized membrane protein
VSNLGYLEHYSGITQTQRIYANMKELPELIEGFRKAWSDKFNRLERIMKNIDLKHSEMEQKRKSEKKKRIAYWVVTILLSIGMVSGGIAQLIKAKPNVDGTIHLGYPLYIMSILGTWKLLGIIALLIPNFLLIKEWAYAGFFFAMTGAVISHIASGDNLAEFIAPLLFAVLTVLSWWMRPENRKLSPVNQTK